MRELLKKIIALLTPDQLKIVRKEVAENLEVGAHDISIMGVDYVGRLEGYSKMPYNDAANHCTIGRGKLLHLGPCTTEDKIRWADGMDKKDAAEHLKKDLIKYVSAVNTYLKVKQNQAQFDALVILCYNIGVAGLRTSSVLRLINKQALFKVIEKRWKVWNKIMKNGKKIVCDGLVNRRAMEWKLYETGEYT